MRIDEVIAVLHLRCRRLTDVTLSRVLTPRRHNRKQGPTPNYRCFYEMSGKARGSQFPT